MADKIIGAVWCLDLVEVERLDKRAADLVMKHGNGDIYIYTSECGQYAFWDLASYGYVGDTIDMWPITDKGYWLSVAGIYSALLDGSIGKPYRGSYSPSKVSTTSDPIICRCELSMLMNVGCPSTTGKKCRSA